MVWLVGAVEEFQLMFSAGMMNRSFLFTESSVIRSNGLQLKRNFVIHTCHRFMTSMMNPSAPNLSYGCFASVKVVLLKLPVLMTAFQIDITSHIAARPLKS